ncbi:FixH family protein [Methylobacterium segetis]|uniref:FixH family protein n=1 Tax=Methylobacterium segetis TaxID=2488750 RepID=UPI00104EFDDC|nr:FixH family protein [Methylobacterium segetis]
MTDQSELRQAPGGSAGRVLAWVFLCLLVVAAALVGAGAGYGLARGAWALPVQIGSLLSGPLAAWLPKGVAEAQSMPADLEDYAFEILEPRTKSGEALLKVRLVRKTTATPVPDAVVFARRLDMAPDGIETMKTKLEPQPSTDRREPLAFGAVRGGVDVCWTVWPIQAQSGCSIPHGRKPAPPIYS